jgi:hypothetical protein
MLSYFCSYTLIEGEFFHARGLSAALNVSTCYYEVCKPVMSIALNFLLNFINYLGMKVVLTHA